MANVAGYKPRILVGEFDYSAYTTTVGVDRTRDVYDTSTFRPAAVDDPDRTFISGLGTGTVTIDGLLDEAAGASGPQTDTLLDGSLQVVTVAWQGGNTIGDRAVVAHVRQDSSPIGLPLDGVVTLSSGRQGSGAVTGGVVLKEFTQELSTANFTGVDHGSATAFGAAANLHVTQFSGTNAVIKVTDSVDEGVYADLITFTTVTGVTSERGTVAGTVNDFARVELTLTGTSITFAVSFARLKQ